MAEIRRQAAEVADQRRAQREAVASWVIVDTDWDKKGERKSAGGGGKKRKAKKLAAEVESGDEEGEARMSDGEGSGEDGEGGEGGEGRREKPAKRVKKEKKEKKGRKKKYVDPDEGMEEDGEGGGDGEAKKAAGGKRGKRVISKETIESSEEDE